MQSKQTRMRHSEIRVAIAHVLRLLVGSLPPGTLLREVLVRNMVLDHISSAYRYLKSVASGAQTRWCAYACLTNGGSAAVSQLVADLICQHSCHECSAPITHRNIVPVTCNILWSCLQRCHQTFSSSGCAWPLWRGPQQSSWQRPCPPPTQPACAASCSACFPSGAQTPAQA